MSQTRTTHDAVRPRDASGRFVALDPSGVDSASDSASDSAGAIVFDGGADAAPVRARPLAASFQFAVLIVLLMIVVAAATWVSAKKTPALNSFGYGLALGAVSGAVTYWVLGSR